MGQLEREFQKGSSAAIEDRYEEVDKGHGRIEVRKCIVSSQIDWLQQKQDGCRKSHVVLFEK